MVLLGVIIILCAGIGLVSAYERIGITAIQYNGNLSGMIGADAKCQSQFGTLGGTWKALVGTTTGRYNGGPDWILAANTEYRRIDGTTVVGTTGANACLDGAECRLHGFCQQLRGLDESVSSANSSAKF